MLYYSRRIERKETSWDLTSMGVNTLRKWESISAIMYGDIADILTEEDKEMGSENNHYIIDKSTAVKMGNKLKEELKLGNTKAYNDQRDEFIGNLPLETCPTCKGEGTRFFKKNLDYVKPPEDEKGKVKHITINQDDIDNAKGGLDELLANIAGAQKEVPCDENDPEAIAKVCNGCSGEGQREHTMSGYPFSEENVEEFAEFCIHSGGFRIS